MKALDMTRRTEDALSRTYELYRHLHAVVMAGGAGERLWPESRASRPKPFLALDLGGKTLIRSCFERLVALAPAERRFVVAGRAFSDLARANLPELLDENLLIEPIGRNTAPCLAWTSLEAVKRDENAIVVALPSDHWIRPGEAFVGALERGYELVEEDATRIVALGVVPTTNSTAFGYIERGEPIATTPGAYRATSFREKPDADAAQEFAESGRFLWNVGVVVVKASHYLSLLKEYEPELAATFDRIGELIDAARREERRVDDDPEFQSIFSSAKKISNDRAIMERASNVAVVASNDFEWNDLGSFAALERATQLREDDSTREPLIVGSAHNVYARVAKKSSSRRKLIAFGDVDDLLVVDTEDALLVARKGDDEAIKRVVEELKRLGLDEYL